METPGTRPKIRTSSDSSKVVFPQPWGPTICARPPRSRNRRIQPSSDSFSPQKKGSEPGSVKRVAKGFGVVKVEVVFSLPDSQEFSPGMPTSAPSATTTRMFTEKYPQKILSVPFRVFRGSKQFPLQPDPRKPGLWRTRPPWRSSDRRRRFPPASSAPRA